MNPLSKYQSKPYVIGVLALILVPSIVVAFDKSSVADFFLCALSVILMLVICAGPFILIDVRKWMKLQDNPEYLYDEFMETGTSKSLKKLEELAKNGNPEAAYLYALVYYYGNNVAPRDSDKAFHWATKAAQQGYGLAQNLLGGLCLNGVGTAVDYQEAVRWFEEAIKSNVYESEAGLYQCYRQGGHGIEQDLHKAFLHLSNHAKRTDNVVSKFTVATWLFDGYGVEENKDEAFKWFKDIANTANLGVSYDSYIDELVVWRQILPDEAIVNAYYNMAVCCKNGYGTPVDEEAANYWMEKYNAAVRDNDEYARLDEKGRREYTLRRLEQC